MTTVEFDQIAEVYDETRRVMDEQTLAGARQMLDENGCRSILEVGVGTGRVAYPLKRSGFEVTGLDISRRMMERAMQKGIADLVLADGACIPFNAKSFNATFMAHVFHIIVDPFSVMLEGARVSRVGVFALFRKRDPNRPWFPFFGEPPAGDEAAKKIFEEKRERFRKIGEKYHWDWERSHRRHNWGMEAEILKNHPPDELKIVSDVLVNDSLEERITRFEKDAYGFMAEMPLEMRQEIVKEMRARASSAPELARQPRHEVYQLAMWRSESLRFHRTRRQEGFA